MRTRTVLRRAGVQYHPASDKIGVGRHKYIRLRARGLPAVMHEHPPQRPAAVLAYKDIVVRVWLLHHARPQISCYGQVPERRVVRVELFTVYYCPVSPQRYRRVLAV